MRENLYFSNYTHNNQKIHSFPALLHNGRYFVNEILSLLISNILGLAYYIGKSPPFSRSRQVLYTKNVCLHFENLFMFFVNIENQNGSVNLLEKTFGDFDSFGQKFRYKISENLYSYSIAINIFFWTFYIFGYIFVLTGRTGTSPSSSSSTSTSEIS